LSKIMHYGRKVEPGAVGKGEIGEKGRKVVSGQKEGKG